MMVIPRKREVCVMNNIKSLEALGFIYNFIRGFEGAYNWGACILGGGGGGEVKKGGELITGGRGLTVYEFQWKQKLKT